MGKHYVVSDGQLVLFLEPAPEGGYNVSSPLDSALITQAETLEEAFVMAYDAQRCLEESRAERARRSEKSARGATRTARPPGPSARSAKPPAKATRRPKRQALVS